jgi:hypothetical protein
MRWAHIYAALQKTACGSRPCTLICASQQGGLAAMSVFLDVSSLNLAVPQGTATFFERSQALRA